MLLPIPNPIPPPPPPNFSAPSFTPDHLLVKPQQISASWFISILSSTSSFARCSYGVRKNPAIRKCEISKLMLAFFCLQRGKRFFIIMITNINNTRLMCICTNFFFFFFTQMLFWNLIFFLFFLLLVVIHKYFLYSHNLTFCFYWIVSLNVFAPKENICLSISWIFFLLFNFFLHFWKFLPLIDGSIPAISLLLYISGMTLISVQRNVWRIY